MAKKRKILCMYSGGLDSVGNLYRLLKDEEFANYRIHVHHLSLKNKEGRAPAERMAVKKTLDYFASHEEFRKFEYTNSLHDYTFMRGYIAYDTFWYAFMAANIMIADQSIEHVAVGRTKSDIDSAASMEHAHRGHEIFHATLPLALRFERSYIYPVAHLKKKEIWDMLPDELRKASWSCRVPVYIDKKPITCGKCKTCVVMKKMLNV